MKGRLPKVWTSQEWIFTPQNFTSATIMRLVSFGLNPGTESLALLVFRLPLIILGGITTYSTTLLIVKL